MRSYLPILIALTSCSPINESPTGQPNPVCQSGDDCCQPSELVCTGDPDNGMVCRCFKSWDCDSALSPEKCKQTPADTPDGSLSWTCKIEGGVETCGRGGSEVPPGKNGWTCQQVGGSVICTRQVNTPDGGGDWDCFYDKELNKFCTKKAPAADQGGVTKDGGLPPPPPKKDSGTPKKDSGAPPPDQGTPTSAWKCTTDASGVTTCKKVGSGMPTGSGPPGGNGEWKCYWSGSKIICEGSSTTPPGGAGWTCVPNEDVGGWRCEKTVTPGDMPPGGGTWGCTSGTSWNGTVCTQNPPPSSSGQVCVPGQKMWCDGQSYCGWGVVVCGPDGKWKTVVNPNTGQKELDCWEPANGVRPNTVCACFFSYFNKDCCERPDCLVPPGTNGQVCAPSAGQFCDYCNPLKPECVGAGNKCLVTSSHETFCGKDCAGGKPCPGGAICQKVTQKTTTLWQCMPADMSCYY